MAGAKGRSGKTTGGAKPGAGRKRSRAINWGLVLLYAKSGAQEKDIIASLDLNDSQLGPAELDKLRATIVRGNALARVELLRDIHVRSKRTKSDGTDGSVNAQALRARNLLDWDRQIPTQEVEPDLGTARTRLGDIMLRLAQQASQVEGRHISVLELLKREADLANAEAK